MRVNPSYKEGVSVAAQDKKEDSVLNFFRKMLALRKEYASSLIFGSYKGIEPDNENTMQYYKQSFDGSQVVCVALNFTKDKQPITLDEVKSGKASLVLSSSTSPDKEHALQPYEGRIYKI